MAHRIEFTKDISLPSGVQQYRLKLQKQIHQLRERQEVLGEEQKQKVLMLQKRLLYGKKKIFSFDRKMDHMTLTDQLEHYKVEVQALKKTIAKQQQQIRQKEKQPSLPELKLQNYPSRMMLPGMDQQSQPPQRSPSSISRFFMVSDKSIKNIIDPQQELLKLTHQIMRLKKSLQQVRSKYSDNFTEYKLRQQYQKLKEQNATMTQQLRQLQTFSTINQNKQANNQQVNYQQMEMLTIKREYQLLLRDKKLLENYLKQVLTQREENQRSDKAQTILFNQDKINRLNLQIEQATKNNQILQNQIHFLDKQISQRYIYQQTLRAKLPS